MFVDEFAAIVQFLEESPVGISVHDSTGRFLSANTNFCRILGYSQEALTARDDWSVLHPDDVPAIRDVMRRLLAGEIRTAVFESRYVRPDGETVWTRNSRSLVRDREGRAVKVITLSDDITGQKQAERTVDRVNHQLRELSIELLRSEERERRRIGRELHDGAAQLLAGLSMQLNRLRDAGLDERHRLDLLGEAIELAGQCSREVRALSYALHPPAVDELGLGGALVTFIEGFRRRTGLDVSLKIAPGLGHLSGLTEAAVFRIVQEGLTNIHKHSGSPVARITLERNAREVCLELVDEGRGLGADAGGSHQTAVGLGVGIRGMRERIELLGGRLEITSGGTGTRVRAFLPAMEANEEVANTVGR